MRCPKCSFISFDLVENCAKCGKSVSKAAEELQGTVASIAPPGFLRFDFEEKAPEAAAAGGEQEFDLGADEEETFVDLGAEEGGAPEAAMEAGDMEIEEDS